MSGFAIGLVVAIAIAEQPAKPAPTTAKAVGLESGNEVIDLEDKRKDFIEGVQIISNGYNKKCDSQCTPLEDKNTAWIKQDFYDLFSAHNR
jgi:hypothetical protein